MRFAHISSNGMITIPKEARKTLGIDEETPLMFEVREDELVMKKASIADDSVINRIIKKYGLDERPKKAILKELRGIRHQVYEEEYE